MQHCCFYHKLLLYLQCCCIYMLPGMLELKTFDVITVDVVMGGFWSQGIPIPSISITVAGSFETGV